MKKASRILLFFLVLTMCMTMLAPITFAADTTKLPENQTYGLDNLNNEEGKLYVAYLGGSITLGAGGSSTISYKDAAGSGHARWASQLTKRYFQKEYPNKEVVEVNAGISGTNSSFGLFRLQRDVVSHCQGEGPDVVFVEFAVNDAPSVVYDSQPARVAMEGIVRQLAHLPKQPVVIFVYTAELKDGNFEKALNSAKVHQEVAEYYGIASINLCEYVKRGTDINGQTIVWDKNKAKSWTNDNTHPNDNGYTGYTDYMIKQFKDSPNNYFKKLTWQEIPMSDYEFGKPKLVHYEEVTPVYDGDWTTEPTSNDMNIIRILGTTMKHTKTDGDTVTLNFKGRSIGIYARGGTNGASVRYAIDGLNVNNAPYFNTYSTIPVPKVLTWKLAPGEHTIQFTVFHPTNNGAPYSPARDSFGFSYFMVDEEIPDPIAHTVLVKADGEEVSEVLSNQPLTGSYKVINSAMEEKGTMVQWVASDSKTGTYTAIEGATGNTYTPDSSMTGKYIKFRVIPKNTEGTVGKTVDSEPVKILRPAAKECLAAEEIVYYNGENMAKALFNGDVTAKTKVTNHLEGSNLTVSMITAEYIVSASGFKMLMQIKRDTKSIAGGATENFANTLTITAAENHIVQTMIITDDCLEPVSSVAQLENGSVVYIG